MDKFFSVDDTYNGNVTSRTSTGYVLFCSLQEWIQKKDVDNGRMAKEVGCNLVEFQLLYLNSFFRKDTQMTESLNGRTTQRIIILCATIVNHR